MMRQQLALGERVEHRWRVRERHRRLDGGERRQLVRQRERRHGAEVEEPVHLLHVLTVELRAGLATEAVEQEVAREGRRPPLHLDAHRGIERPPLRGAGHGVQQVVGALLVEIEIAAARHAKRVRPFHGDAGMHEVEVAAHQLLDGDDVARRPRNRNEARERMRDLAFGEVQRSALRPPDHGGKSERAVRQVRQRMPGAQRERDRRELGMHVAIEERAQRLPRRPVELLPATDVHAGARQLHHACGDAARLAVGELGGGASNEIELLTVREPVVALLFGLLARGAPQPGHAHHVELVHVRRHDGEEAQALAERRAVALREREHPVLEGEQAQLGVQELRVRGGARRWAQHSRKRIRVPGANSRLVAPSPLEHQLRPIARGARDRANAVRALELARDAPRRLRTPAAPVHAEAVKAPRVPIAPHEEPVVVQLHARAAEPVQRRSSRQTLDLELEAHDERTGIHQRGETRRHAAALPNDPRRLVGANDLVDPIRRGAVRAPERQRRASVGAHAETAEHAALAKGVVRRVEIPVAEARADGRRRRQSAGERRVRERLQLVERAELESHAGLHRRARGGRAQTAPRQRSMISRLASLGSPMVR